MNEQLYMNNVLQAVVAATATRLDRARAASAELSVVVAVLKCGLLILQSDRHVHLISDIRRDLEILAFLFEEYLPALEALAAGEGGQVSPFVQLESTRTREFSTEAKLHRDERQAKTPKKAAALALADALAFVLRAQTAQEPSGKFVRAVAEMDAGDDAAIGVHWPTIQEEGGRAICFGQPSMKANNFTRLALEKRLAGQERAVVEAACELLAISLGGTPGEFLRAWGQL